MPFEVKSSVLLNQQCLTALQHFVDVLDNPALHGERPKATYAHSPLLDRLRVCALAVYSLERVLDVKNGCDRKHHSPSLYLNCFSPWGGGVD